MNVDTAQTLEYLPIPPRRHPRSDAGESDSIGYIFGQHFCVRLATTRRLRDMIHRMRYKVYCEEFGWEDKVRYPTRFETDQYDKKSLHCLILHRSSGLAAACVRLIPPDPDHTESPLPVESFFDRSLDHELLRKVHTERSSFCEISRLTVARTFRRRARESDSRCGAIAGKIVEITRQEQRVFPLIGISVILAATVLAELTGRLNAFAMMEPFLPRAIGRVGLTATQVGPIVEYHGLRAPYSIPGYDAERLIRPQFQELYQDIKESLTSDFRDAILRRNARDRKIRL